MSDNVLRLEFLKDASTNQRSTKRIHLPVALLKTLKIAAGDFVIVRPCLSLEHGLDGLRLDSQSASHANALAHEFILGQAWPVIAHDNAQSKSLSHLCDETYVMLSSAVGLPSERKQEMSFMKEGQSVIVQSMLQSGLVGAELTQITLKPCSVLEINLKSQMQLLKAHLKQLLAEFKCIKEQERLTLTLNGRAYSFETSQLHFDAARVEASIGLVTQRTEVIIAENRTTQRKESIAPMDPLLAYSRVGGLNNQIQQIRELIEVPFTRPEIYKHFGLQAPKGILFYGPPGTGKTLLAASIANSLGIPRFLIAGASLSSPFHGETESKLRDVFTEAKSHDRSIIVLDEIDALAPKREDSGEVERRVVAELLTLMDGLDDKENTEGKSGRVLVIACTNRPNAIDPALRRPGRFDKEIEIGIPDVEARLSILTVHLASTPHELPSTVIEGLAARTHGYVGADLASLTQTACINAIRRCTASDTPLHEMKLTETDLEAALVTTQPSAMREVSVEVPTVYWKDIGGQEEVKQQLKEAIEWPLRHGATFKRLGAKPPSGLLLYGPPGCSKTLIAKAIATESGLNFMSVKGAEVLNKYLGESERTVRELFRKARANAPAVLFLDELDVIAGSRTEEEASAGRVLTTLLTEMDGIESLRGVVILAATNRPWSIDSALLRPGRLDRLLFVGPPDLEARRKIFEINTSKMTVDASLDLDQLSKISEGCSGAEIASICQNAALSAMNEDIDAPFIKALHFYVAAQSMRRGIQAEDLALFHAWRNHTD